MPRGKLIEHTVWAVNQCHYIMSGEHPQWGEAGSGRSHRRDLGLSPAAVPEWGYITSFFKFLARSLHSAGDPKATKALSFYGMMRIRKRVTLRIMHLRKQFIPINTKQIKMGSTGALIMLVLEG